MQLWGARSEKIKGHLLRLGSCWGGDPNLFSLHSPPGLCLFPFAFPPTASWEGALSKWDAGVKAGSSPALSAPGPARDFHTERALSDLTAAHAGSPAPPGPFGREENWPCAEPCLHRSSLEWPKSQVAGDPPRESPSEVFPPSCWGSSTSLPHEPKEWTLVPAWFSPTPAPRPALAPWPRTEPQTLRSEASCRLPRELPPPIQLLPVPAHVFLLPGMFKPSLYL